MLLGSPLGPVGCRPNACSFDLIMLGFGFFKAVVGCVENTTAAPTDCPGGSHSNEGQGFLIFTLQFKFLFVAKIGFSFTFVFISHVILNTLFYSWKIF